MDCKTARLLLDFARPLCPELETADAEALHNHLAECPECGPFAHQERRLDEHLGRAVRDVPVPEDFKQRLLNRLSKERDAWYWRRVRWGLSTAAAVLLALVGAWYFWPMPQPSADQIQMEARDKDQANEEMVAGYFQRQGFAHLSLPTQFDFRYLKDYYVQVFEGRRVPVLRFERSKGDMPVEYVKVLVMSDSQFQLKELVENPRAESGVPKVLVLEQPGDPHVVFVVIYNANDINAFVRPGVPFL